MKHLKYQVGFFFLLLSFSSMAQKNEGVQIEGNVSGDPTIIGKLIKYVTINNHTIIEIDTVAIKNLLKDEIKPVKEALDGFIREQKLIREQFAHQDSIKSDSIMRLNERIHISENALDLVKKRQQEIDEKKWKALPLGIHQFKNGQTGKGIFFSVTEIGLLGTSIGYGISAYCNLNKHKDNKYEQWERDRYYDKYDSHLCRSGWFLAGAIVMIGLNYCDNFNWFRKNNIDFVAIPTFDLQGKPQMAMTLNVKF